MKAEAIITGWYTIAILELLFVLGSGLLAIVTFFGGIFHGPLWVSAFTPPLVFAAVGLSRAAGSHINRATDVQTIPAAISHNTDKSAPLEHAADSVVNAAQALVDAYSGIVMDTPRDQARHVQLTATAQRSIDAMRLVMK